MKKPKSDPTSKGGGAGETDKEVAAAIGIQLRKMYDHVLNEPVPDRLLDLLGGLDEGAVGKPEEDGGKSGSGSRE